MEQIPNIPPVPQGQSIPGQGAVPGIGAGQGMPGEKKLNLNVDPQSLTFKTMPRGYVPPIPTRITPMPPASIEPERTPEMPQAPKKGISAVARMLLIVLALGFLAFAGYFGYTKFYLPKQTQSDNILLKQPNKNNQNPNPAPAPAPQPAAAQSQIPDSWRQKYFGAALCTNQDVCGDDADPDHDGLTNLQENKASTDPNNPDSDADGIADGDEMNVFNLDPLSGKTAGIQKFTDAGDVSFKYNSHTHAAFTDTELVQIAANIKQYGLHSPTIKTLKPEIIDFYTNYNSTQGALPATGALDRDTQRLNTIKQISFALLKYRDANQAFPDTSDYNAMVSAIKPLLTGKAVNTTDPTNVAPYVYTYQSINSGADFQLTYYSETQNQAIITRAADAQKALGADQQAQRDTKRVNDLEQISQALNLYSNDHANPNDPTQKVFPPAATWKQSLQTKYLAIIPVDPKTGQDYVYSVSADHATFNLQATLEAPPTGKTAYACTPLDCDYK